MRTIHRASAVAATIFLAVVLWAAAPAVGEGVGTTSPAPSPTSTTCPPVPQPRTGLYEDPGYTGCMVPSTSAIPPPSTVPVTYSPPRTTARTGVDITNLLRVAVVLFSLGTALLLLSRKRSVRKARG